MAGTEQIDVQQRQIEVEQAFLRAMFPNMAWSYLAAADRALTTRVLLPETGNLHVLSKHCFLTVPFEDGSIFAEDFDPKKFSNGIEAFVGEALESAGCLGFVPVMSAPAWVLENNPRVRQVDAVTGWENGSHPLYIPEYFCAPLVAYLVEAS